jgi:hypothetical protein
MALLECPECKHHVSDRAAACPSCGMPVAEMFEIPGGEKAPEEIRDSEEGMAIQEAKNSEEETKTAEDRPTPTQRWELGLSGKCVGVFIAALVVNLGLSLCRREPFMLTSPEAFAYYLGGTIRIFAIAMVPASFRKGTMGLLLGIAGTLVVGFMILSVIDYEKSRLEQSLINIPAQILNLHHSDIGDSCFLTSDLGIAEFKVALDSLEIPYGNYLTDASARTFQCQGRSLTSTVILIKEPMGSRDFKELFAGFKNTCLKMDPGSRFTDIGSLALGDEAFMIKADLPGQSGSQYFLGFRMANVVGTVISIGTGSKEQAKSMAQRIVQRIAK